MTQQSNARGAKSRVLTRERPKNKDKNSVKVIPSHLAPLIPGLESFQALEIHAKSDDQKAQNRVLEPHYDIEHFVPVGESGYRGVTNDPLRTNKLGLFNFGTKKLFKRRKAKLESEVNSDTASLVPASGHGLRLAVTPDYVVTLRCRELTPDHTDQDPISAEYAALLRCEQYPSGDVPEIVITPSPPLDIDLNFGIFDNTLLRPPPVCFKKKHRRRQAHAEEVRMLKLLWRNSPSGCDRLVQPMSSGASRAPELPGTAEASSKTKSNIEPPVSALDRYAYSLFG